MLLLRSALIAALVLTSVLALPTVMATVRGPGPQGPVVSGGQVTLRGLEAGACMSFGPTAGHAQKTVFIDPGHGGLDPGVVSQIGSTQLLEKDMTLAVATRLKALLQGDGYRVVLSRTRDTSSITLAADDSVTGALTDAAEHRDLITRAACANAAGAAVLLSIHFDAFNDPSVGGTETFYDGARSFATANKRLAEDLQHSLVSALGTADRGVWTDDQIAAPTLTAEGAAYGHLVVLGPADPGYVDNPSQMPGALVEPLFITNPAEARIAASTSGQDRIAAALRDGLEKYLTGS